MIKEVNEEFVLKEIALVAYRIAVHKLIKSFSSIQFDHMSRGYKKHADALATLPSKLIFLQGSWREEEERTLRATVAVLVAINSFSEHY